VTARLNNDLELHSTKSPMREENKFNLYRISEQQTDGNVSVMDKLSKESKFIVGTSKGHLSVFDYGSADVSCCRDIMYAHSSKITGVSSHPSSKSEFQALPNCYCFNEIFI
jgi:hypothetical protein